MYLISRFYSELFSILRSLFWPIFYAIFALFSAILHRILHRVNAHLAYDTKFVFKNQWTLIWIGCLRSVSKQITTETVHTSTVKPSRRHPISNSAWLDCKMSFPQDRTLWDHLVRCELEICASEQSIFTQFEYRSTSKMTSTWVKMLLQLYQKQENWAEGTSERSHVVFEKVKGVNLGYGFIL